MASQLGPASVVSRSYVAVCKHWQSWVTEWLNLSVLSSSGATAANAHQWASHAMASASSHDPSFKSLKWSYMAWTLSWNLAHGSDLEVPVGLCLSLSSGWVHSHLCWRHSFTEFRISWWMFSSISAAQGLLPGDLCSWYMSFYTFLISSLVNPGPVSSMADGSASKSLVDIHPGRHQCQTSFLLPVWVSLPFVPGF